MKKIVFVHGMFVTNRCWDGWVEYFGKRGFTCAAPPWPLKDVSANELRAKHPDFDGEGKIRLGDIVSFYEKYISHQSEITILIGHSMGGLIVQILLNKGLGSAGIAIDSAPPKGVLTTKLSFLKSNWPLLNPFSGMGRPVLLTKKQFQYAFADHLDGSGLDQAYEGVVPQSKLVGLGALTSVAKIDFSKKTTPLLVIAGERDKIIPASLNKSNYRKYSGNTSRTDFTVFPRRTHYLINDEGWQEIADYILNWLNTL